VKKALLIYHSNIFNSTCGTNNRILNIIKLLSSFEIEFDQFVPRSFENDWSSLNKTLISQVFIEDNPKKEKFKLIKRIVRKIKRTFITKKNKFDWIEKSERERFKEILKSYRYDYVIFSYIYYTRLVDSLMEGTKKILLLEDFATVQAYQEYNRDLGLMIEEEVKLIDEFDYAIGISIDELAFFSSLIKNVKLIYLPYFFDRGKELVSKRYIDILFFASDNWHNQYGINWFLKYVYPLIRQLELNIVIAGKIVNAINQSEYPSITFIKHIDKIQELYSRTKIAVSPLHSGTGLKIKIVEAMSYGVPVVCTFKSLIGFPNKFNNGCTIADDPTKFADSIIKILQDKDVWSQLSEEGKKQYDEYFCTKNAEEILSIIFN
jgi:glycosyltransferase involved in cell wall biosynthesis